MIPTMNIYFTAATTDDGQYREQYKLIISSLKKLHYHLVSGEQIADLQLLIQDKKLTDEQIFEREKDRIEKADCVVAEVTRPSSGVGGEIVYALVHNKPVLALVYQDAENRLSPMIAGNPSENLYLEHYEDDNIAIVLRRFLEQVILTKKRKGKLIVIDGGDGSGKATQSELLVDYLKDQGIHVKYMDFPRYYSSFHGRIVGRFLSGEFGKLDEVSPYLSSLAYALDRASAKEEMDAWLGTGGMIVANRYATSSMAHQGARVPKEKYKEFVAWIDELEYKVHRIPREDIVIYLYVPWEIGVALTAKKDERRYVAGGGADIAEKDIKHRQEAEVMYLTLAKERKNWVVIDCIKNGTILPKEEIHKKILAVLSDKHIVG